MTRLAALAAAPAKNEPVSGAESFFGAMTWTGNPNLNPVVGVFAAVKLEKEDDVAESGFESLSAGDGVVPGLRPLVLGVPIMLGFMGVVAVNGLGAASLSCSLAMLEARPRSTGGSKVSIVYFTGRALSQLSYKQKLFSFSVLMTIS